MGGLNGLCWGGGGGLGVGGGLYECVIFSEVMAIVLSQSGGSLRKFHKRGSEHFAMHVDV